MLNFDCGTFRSTYDAEKGKEIWDFLKEADSIIRMETATYLRRPAVEPLSSGLWEKFGARVKKNRVKQMIGRMVRQIMEDCGYRLDRNSVRITREGNIFSSGSRYTK